jgi:hypothetical protein
VWDGVGSGLHIDDEPDEIFPLPISLMSGYCANDVPSAVQFLTRYSRFFGGMNFVLHDKKKRSIAVEKCSRNHMETFEPDPVSGFSYCSGMACRDPESAQGLYQKAKRDEYCRLFDLPDDGPDRVFWAACDRTERMLAEGVRAMGPRPSCEDVFTLFTTPWPDGLNKPGILLHPEQAVPQYTLISHATLIDERMYYRWMRDEKLVFPDEPEVYRY